MISKRLGNLFILLSNPMLIPLWGIIYLLYSGSYISYMSFEAKKNIILFTGLASLVFPILSLYFMLSLKIIGSITKLNSKSKLYLYFILTFYLLAAWYVLYELPISKYLQHFILGIGIVYSLTSLLNLLKNFSINLAGIGALSGGILSFGLSLQLQVILMLMILFSVAGLTAYYLLLNKKNTESEIYIPFVMGFVIQFYMMSL